jgi:hypothetical protein
MILPGYLATGEGCAPGVAGPLIHSELSEAVQVYRKPGYEECMTPNFLICNFGLS